MNRETVENQLREVIAGRMPGRPDPASIPTDIPIFQKGLGLDSMSGLELITEIEKRFDVYIDDDDFDIFDSLGALIEFVAERAKGPDQ
ncbi:MAG TPA: acyl carrier protein [Patescibacteria group bacterium]|nr:acyl carrier protein [Patescibacteria group bacterium]